MAVHINIAANQDKPCSTVKRRHGKTNIGLYCDHCSEFFALAVIDRPPPEPIEHVSNGLVLFECPMCDQRQKRDASEIVQIVLTDKNKRKLQILH